MKLNIENLRCVFCGSHSLDIYNEPLKCNVCGHEYPNYKGIKFLGCYNNNDTLGLLEITSKISKPIDPLQIRKNIEKSELKLSDDFKNTYVERNTNDVNDKVVLGSNKMAQQVRLREWAGFELLSKDIDFNNKLCLDIGAGLGTDSIRLIIRGAKLVCLDFNPVSIYSGSLIVPEAQWLGGNVDCLPFASDTFDYTIANAALHHMNDQYEAVKEMYRVTKPGGFVFLISDPFCKKVNNEHEHELEELRSFDEHPMVMNGINESLIPFNKYIKPLELLDSDVKLLTMKIHEHSEISDMPTYWSLDKKSITYLENKAGNISSIIKVSTKELEETTVKSEELPAKLLFQYIGDPRKSINFLLPHIPERYFDDFPFMTSSKFLLMNGWNVKQDFNSDWRKGYNRTRLFLTFTFLETKEIWVKIDDQNTIDRLDMYLSLNGERILQFTVQKNNIKEIPIAPSSTLNDKNVLELGVADENENKGAIWSPYNLEKTFSVSIHNK